TQLFETAKFCSDEYIGCTKNIYSKSMFSNNMICIDEEELERVSEIAMG
ncbi:2997_t:CDS:1, partial [Entrophospora sp. SA101]